MVSLITRLCAFLWCCLPAIQPPAPSAPSARRPLFKPIRRTAAANHYCGEWKAEIRRAPGPIVVVRGYTIEFYDLETARVREGHRDRLDRKSTRLNSSHGYIS